MDILEMLREDHENLRATMDHLEADSTNTEQLRRFATELLAHAREEDDLLFVPLEDGLPPDQGPLAVMRYEHEAIDAGLMGLVEGAGPAPAPAELSALLELTRGHFLKEEQVLFSIAERLLDRERRLRLGTELEARRAAG